jgi:hypothetical protein
VSNLDDEDFDRRARPSHEQIGRPALSGAGPVAGRSVVTLPILRLAGELAAVVARSLPLGICTTPATIMLERAPDHGTLARVGVVEAIFT